jgi:hypothetical protein
MNLNSRGHNLDTRFEELFPEIKHPPGHKDSVGVSSSLVAGKNFVNEISRLTNLVCLG